MSDLERIINDAFEQRAELTPTRHDADVRQAVDSALAYQQQHPETLVLVTGDHETGGITLGYDEDREIVMEYASGAHTGTLLPLFASGPGAERFAGIIRNDSVGQLLIDIVGGGPSGMR